MADIICVIGNKGGTGKTTMSHMLAHGMALLGHRSVCVLTDACREPLDPAGRSYLIADARSRDALARVTDKIRSLKAWMGVIDGGGNRTEMDRRLYALSDLVLLPFRDSPEDMRTLIRDLEMFPQAFAVPSQWPIIPWQRDAAQRVVDEWLTPYRERVLMPVPALSFSKQLLQKRISTPLPAHLDMASRDLARQICTLLNIPIYESDDAALTHALAA
jgi:chromosome partitioning protein